MTRRSRFNPPASQADTAPSGSSVFLSGTGYGPKFNYNPQTGIYNLKGSNWKHARAALAKARAGTGLCRVGVIGDSIVAGYHATTISSDAWPNAMSNYLVLKGYPRAGTGDVMTGSLGVWSASNPDPRLSGNFTLIASTDNTGGFGMTSAANGRIHTFTSDVAGTIAEFSYGVMPTFTGSFTVTIKNQAGTILSGPTAFSSTAAANLLRVSVTGLVLDVGSTIVFTSTNTGVNAIFSAGVRNATGLLVSNLGIGTSSTSTWNSFAAPTPFNPGYVSSKLFANLDILLVGLGVNDATNPSSGVTVAQYKTNLASIVSTLKLSGTDVALVHPIPGIANSVNLWTQSPSAGWNSSVFYSMADTLDCPLIDESDRWQDYATANTSGLMFDTVHPNTSGYQRIALDVAGFFTI